MGKLKSAEEWSNEIIALSEKFTTEEIIELIQQNVIDAISEKTPNVKHSAFVKTHSQKPNH